MKVKIGFAFLSFMLLVTGCGTWSLESNAKMTKSVFLKDLSPEKTIYLVTTNTTASNSNLNTLLVSEIEKKGYKFLDTPDSAMYTLRVNLLNANSAKEQNVVKAAAVGGATTGLVGYAATGSGSNATGGALIGAAGAALFAYATADGVVRMQASVLISEKTEGEAIEHKTKIIAEAKQMHLSPEKGQSILEEKISKQIAGIFL